MGGEEWDAPPAFIELIVISKQNKYIFCALSNMKKINNPFNTIVFVMISNSIHL